MGKYVVERLIKELIHEDIPVRRAKVAVLGFTFKENCPDIRNTRAADIVSELREYGMDPRVIDPLANKCDAKQIYDVKLSDMDELQQMDAIIVAVAHESFAHLDVRDFDQFFDQQSKKKKIILDVKGILQKEDLEKSGYSYWRL